MSKEHELLKFLLQDLVDDPDKIVISAVEGSRSTILEVRATPEDIGKIIGKRGRIIKALRTILNAAAVRDGKRVVLEVIDKDGTPASSTSHHVDDAEF